MRICLKNSTLLCQTSFRNYIQNFHLKHTPEKDTDSPSPDFPV